ncbi:hypothetical protein TNCT_301371 [Trichonephila clavata]|uniref:Uncharacterized protein n=1 Tax=Trichonephila clavata TaxID=2740835 RepID=A0A8X6L3L1_TRICU|nr:hypothetical protein TNCT_540631 [Trichonephila clavata]GFR29752.1 hypothetical protein TNCT_301371 [Trichonephila clavata]
MAKNSTTLLMRLGMAPFMWFLQLMIMMTGKYLAYLIKLFFYLEHVSDNLNKTKIPPKNKENTNKSRINALKYLKRIVDHHRKKHLKIRNKIKFHPTLPTIDEEDETDPTPCNSPYLPPPTQPLTETTSNNSTLSTPKAIQPLNLTQNFSNYSFLIPDFIVPSNSAPSNFDSNFATQFNSYIQQKNNRKPFRYIKRKFKSIKQKLFKKNNP